MLAGRLQLAIHVGCNDDIEIDQRELPDGTARKCFDDPGANAAEPDNDGMTAGKARQGGIAVDAADSGKAAIVVIIRR